MLVPMAEVLPLLLLDSQPDTGLLTLPVAEGPPWTSWSPSPTAALVKEDRIMTKTLSGVLAEHVRAVNAFDENAIVATFAEDALVNDAHREFWGAASIRAWVAKEMVGDNDKIVSLIVIRNTPADY
jgi:hypothetical protein